MYYQNGSKNMVLSSVIMLRKKTILFILPSLKAGGSERVLSFVAKNINPKIFSTHLIVIGYKKDCVFDISGLPVSFLNCDRALFSIPKLFVIIYRHKPSIIFSTIGHVNLLMGFFSLFFQKTKFVGRESSVFSLMNKISGRNSSIYNLLYQVFYSRLDFIICQSEDMKYDLCRTLNLSASKVIIINNPITHEIKRTYNKVFVRDIIRFITVGRLSDEKGYLRLLQCLSYVKSYDFFYTIVGSGPQERLIKEHVNLLNLGSKINFVNYTPNVLDIIMKHDVYLQGSFVEGFPNALLESCSVGIPAIAFNVPGGTREIIQDGINGILVNDIQDFIKTLNNNILLRSFDNNIVRLSVQDNFNATKIINKYEVLFNSL